MLLVPEAKSEVKKSKEEEQLAEKLQKIKL